MGWGLAWPRPGPSTATATPCSQHAEHGTQEQGDPAILLVFNIFEVILFDMKPGKKSKPQGGKPKMKALGKKRKAPEPAAAAIGDRTERLGKAHALMHVQQVRKASPLLLEMPPSHTSACSQQDGRGRRRL